MAIALRGTPTSGSKTFCGTVGSNTVTVTKPTGVVANDVIVVQINWAPSSCCATPTSITAPSGWTQVDQNGYTTGSRSAVFIRKSDGTDGASYSFAVAFTGGGGGGKDAGAAFWGAVAYSGVDTTTQQDATAVAQTNTSSTNFAAGSITTVTANAQVLALYSWIGTGAFTPPSGFSAEINHTGTSQHAGMAFCDATQATAGATGTLTGTMVGAKVSRAVTMALRPAAGGGLTASNDETTTATDAYTPTMSAPVTYAESASPSDAYAGLLAAIATLNETTTATDTMTPSALAAMNESASAADAYAATAAFVATLAEIASPTDAFHATAAFATAIAESVVPADAFTASMSASATLSEIVSPVDAFAALATAMAALNETVSPIDLLTPTASMSASVHEIAVAVDSVIALAAGAYFASLAETVSATDTMSAFAPLSGAIHEVLTITDTYGYTFNPGGGEADDFIWLKRRRRG